MRVLIDADGCPVVNETISVSRRAGAECLILCDTAHHFEREGARTLTVSKGADSVDFALVNLVQAGDVVVTQDYGLAAMCLARGARILNQDGMEYTDADGQKKRPYIIHRTSLGCYERTLAYLIEKYAGALPLWLAPEQARIMTITDRADEAAIALRDKLTAAGLRVETDLRNEKIGYKIREAQSQKIPYMLVLGDKEAENDTISVRTLSGEQSVEGLSDFIARLQADVKSRKS